jgi:hypothetical protein
MTSVDPEAADADHGSQSGDIGGAGGHPQGAHGSEKRRQARRAVKVKMAQATEFVAMPIGW